MKKKEADLLIAFKIIEDCIKNQRFRTLAYYIELAWSKNPSLRSKDVLNVRVMEYQNKQKEKNEKNNIVRFIKRTIN